ncbi:MAG: hypothetical protein ACW981_07845 [Candidatus Hodarchaeales archaeon]|jgi:hypothetical protein
MEIFSISIFDNHKNEIFAEVNENITSLSDSELLTSLHSVLKVIYKKNSYDESKAFKLYEFECLVLHLYRSDFFSLILIANEIISENTFYTLSLNIVKALGNKITEDEFTVAHKQLFYEAIKEIFPEFIAKEGKTPIEPTKYLDTASIFSLHPTLQQIALSMLYLQEASVDEIAKESNYQLDDTQREVEILINMGYLGRNLNNRGEMIYYCKS